MEREPSLITPSMRLWGHRPGDMMVRALGDAAHQTAILDYLDRMGGAQGKRMSDGVAVTAAGKAALGDDDIELIEKRHIIGQQRTYTSRQRAGARTAFRICPGGLSTVSAARCQTLPSIF